MTYHKQYYPTEWWFNDLTFESVRLWKNDVWLNYYSKNDAWRSEVWPNRISELRTFLETYYLYLVIFCLSFGIHIFIMAIHFNITSSYQFDQSSLDINYLFCWKEVTSSASDTLTIPPFDKRNYFSQEFECKALFKFEQCSHDLLFGTSQFFSVFRVASTMTITFEKRQKKSTTLPIHTPRGIIGYKRQLNCKWFEQSLEWLEPVIPINRQVWIIISFIQRDYLSEARHASLHLPNDSFFFLSSDSIHLVFTFIKRADSSTSRIWIRLRWKL